MRVKYLSRFCRPGNYELLRYIALYRWAHLYVSGISSVARPKSAPPASSSPRSSPWDWMRVLHIFKGSFSYFHHLLRSRHLLRSLKFSMRSPSYFFGLQMSSQLAKQWPPLHCFLPLYNFFFLFLSIKLITTIGRRKVDIQNVGRVDNTKFIKASRPPRDSNLSFHADSFLSILPFHTDSFLSIFWSVKKF